MQQSIVNHYLFGTMRNVLLGGSLCYAIKKEQYFHLPIILFFPSVYTGYHLYENKELVARWIREMKK